MKKNIALFLTITLIVTALVTPFFEIEAAAMFVPDEKPQSEGVYLYNVDLDTCVFAQNENTKYYPASTTKIMTALVALENCKDLDAKVKVPYDCFNEFFSDDSNKVGASSAAIEPLQANITYRDCLYALMLASACEAANILAYNLGGGDMGNFMTMMNQKAVALGCKNTNFGNPHGLHQNNNYSTAYDMFLITKAAYNTPLFMEICNTYQYEMPPNKANPKGYNINHTNKLIKNSTENPYYYPYAKGVKTGSIDYYIDNDTGKKEIGGRCLVSTATKGEFTYILVTLNAPYFDAEGKANNSSFEDHIMLYNWAFETFLYTKILSKADIVTQMSVLQGENADRVQLHPSMDFSMLISKEVDIKTGIQRIVTADKTITAPVQKGQILGSVELLLGGETVAKVDLVATEDVRRSQLAYFTDKLKEVLDTVWFRLGIVTLVVLIIALVVLSAIRKNRRATRKRR